MNQLGLFDRYDELCSVLRISAPHRLSCGGLQSEWLRGNPGRGRTAWSVRAVPPGCPAYERGARWFICASIQGPTFATSMGPYWGPGGRDGAIRYAQHLLVSMELRHRRDQVLRHQARLILRRRALCPAGVETNAR